MAKYILTDDNIGQEQSTKVEKQSIQDKTILWDGTLPTNDIEKQEPEIKSQVSKAGEMNLNEIQKIARRLYSPLIALETIFPHRKRKFLAEIFLVLTIFSATAVLILYGYEYFLQTSNYASLINKLLGGSLISLSLWAIFFASNAFFYSFYFWSPAHVNGLFIDFDLAYSIDRLIPEDITGSFFSLLLGQRFLLRTGINGNLMDKFLSQRQTVLKAGEFKFQAKDNILNLVDFTLALYKNDAELRQFLFSQGIQEKDLMAIAEWIMEIHAARHSLEGWWSKDHLLQIKGIGQSWSYGQTYKLDRYERQMPFANRLRYGVRTFYGEEELQELQNILAKRQEGNAILVGNDVSSELQIISRLNQKIQNNLSIKELKAKRIIILDTPTLTSQNGDKALFESEFISILNEATGAGNIILVIDDMPSFVSSASSFGTDLPTLLGPYLVREDLKVVAMSTTDPYHRTLEKNGFIAQYFEIVHMKEVDDLNTVKILQNEAAKFEARGVLFTYLALTEIAKSAVRYFPEGVMPNKAIDLLVEIVPEILATGKTIIEKNDVLKLIEQKTGIPVGEVKKEEKEKLLNLENILRARIVGQNEAVTAISNAMRRARSGIENPDRPMGSFLFLGPTGVGKTETTKALAEVFFGDQSHIMRLDMSEYSSIESLAKLIGSFELDLPGILSSMIREHPYGVLLLDEFEKTTREVMNLFLQILDEGFFSDMKGKKVIMRNLIIIATSNAGSDLIWQAMKDDKDLAKEKEEIIDQLIKEKIFTPELLNRFDGVVLFHLLSPDEMRKIAELSLNKLKNRLAEKGIDLVITGDLIDFVLSHGADPKFGARPINRAIAEDLEQMISKKIIAGSVSPGMQLTFNQEDLT